MIIIQLDGMSIKKKKKTLRSACKKHKIKKKKKELILTVYHNCVTLVQESIKQDYFFGFF
jgi:hypothetical protein